MNIICALTHTAGMKTLKIIALSAAAAALACGAACSKGQTGGGNNTLKEGGTRACACLAEEEPGCTDTSGRSKHFEFDDDRGMPEKKGGFELIVPNAQFGEDGKARPEKEDGKSQCPPAPEGNQNCRDGKGQGCPERHMPPFPGMPKRPLPGTHNGDKEGDKHIKDK